ncbi:hypothetical protein D9M68_923130 [compost metagenome]
MQTASAYVQSDTYHHAIDKLEAIARTFEPAAPDMVRSAIIQVLGEELGIWPVNCLRDIEATAPRLVA